MDHSRGLLPAKWVDFAWAPTLCTAPGSPPSPLLAAVFSNWAVQVFVVCPGHWGKQLAGPRAAVYRGIQ